MKKIISIIFLMISIFAISCTKKEENIQEFDKKQKDIIISVGESEKLGIGGEAEQIEQIIDSQASIDTQSQDFRKITTSFQDAGETFE